MREICVVPTFRRSELLYCCLHRLREQDEAISIVVFSDRGETSADLERTCEKFEAQLIVQSRHEFYGNSFNAGEALKFAYHSGYDLVHYIEDDAFAKPDLLVWSRKQHADWDDIFCSCGWVFNHHMTMEEGTYFVPWIYIPQFTITRSKLALLVEHLNPLYYADMWGYLRDNFADNPINKMFPNVVHTEIDGLMQRIIMASNHQVAWNGIGKVAHMGFGGYNRGGYTQYEELLGAGDFATRVARIEQLMTDPYWRVETFGRKIVERELGYHLPERELKYRVRVGEYESVYTSALDLHALPRRINSVPVSPDMHIARIEEEKLESVLK